MSIPTAKAHVSYARDKADLNNRAQIAVLVHDAGEPPTSPQLRVLEPTG